MFNFLKRRKQTIEIRSLGTFNVHKENGGFDISGKYNSRLIGEIEICFITKTVEVSSELLNKWKTIEKNWSQYKKQVPQGFQFVSIVIVEKGCTAYADIDAEIVLVNREEYIKSMIIVDNTIDQIIDI